MMPVKTLVAAAVAVKLVITGARRGWWRTPGGGGC